MLRRIGCHPNPHPRACPAAHSLTVVTKPRPVSTQRRTRSEFLNPRRSRKEQNPCIVRPMIARAKTGTTKARSVPSSMTRSWATNAKQILNFRDQAWTDTQWTDAPFHTTIFTWCMESYHSPSPTPSLRLRPLPLAFLCCERMRLQDARSAKGIVRSRSHHNGMSNGVCGLVTALLSGGKFSKICVGQAPVLGALLGAIQFTSTCPATSCPEDASRRPANCLA